METLFCPKCGNKIETEGSFCPKCGAPLPVTPPACPQPPTYTPPAGLKHGIPVYAIVLITVAGVLLLGALIFGAWKLWLDQPVIAPEAAMASDAAVQLPTTRTASAPVLSPEPSAAPASTEPALSEEPTPSAETTPEPSASATPVPAKQVEFADIIGQKKVHGLTEQEAVALLGNPDSRDVEENEEGNLIILTYKTYTVTLPDPEGNKDVPYCTTIFVTGKDCPVNICGLSVGMAADEIKAQMATQKNFKLSYAAEDGSFVIYHDESANHDVMAWLEDGVAISCSATGE